MKRTRYCSIVVLAAWWCVAGAGCAGRGAVFTSDVDTNAKPWTNLAFHNAPENFRFAIVSDLHGAARPGVMEKAVASLNRLQPEFVVSMGDLIPGYTNNMNEIGRQWREIDSVLARLETPLFFVPGNHDVTTENMRDAWMAKRGCWYYSFVYRDVLFLVLNTEDGGLFSDRMGGFRLRSGISKAQAEYVADVLRQHRDVRWTFVFMHQPLWVFEEGLSKESARPMNLGFKRVQDLLEGRNYTVLAGHFHDYQAHERRGQHYYILATTGGRSGLQGPAAGEFDEIAWVAMTPAGPRLSNLMLDGILGEGVRTEEQVRGQEKLLKTCPDLAKITFDAAALAAGGGGVDLQMQLTNPLAEDMVISTRWLFPGSPWEITPVNSQLTIKPGQSDELHWHARYLGEAKAPPLRMPLPQAAISITSAKLVLFENLKVPLQPKDLAKELARVRPALQPRFENKPPTIDGQLDDACWQRPADADGLVDAMLTEFPPVDTRWWVSYDRHNLYLACKAQENNFARIKANVRERDGSVWEDDSLEVFINPKPDGGDYYHFAVNSLGTLADGMGKTLEWDGEITCRTGRGAAGWTMEMAIPWKTLGLDGPPEKGSKLGFNLQRNRPQGSPNRVQWAPTLGTSHKPQLFGVLEF
jgi:Icc-related predicted phosphoesterase